MQLQVANAIFMMPRDQRDSNPVIQALLQGMSWCEKDRQADIASRNAYIASQGRVRALLPICQLTQPPSSQQRHLCNAF